MYLQTERICAMLDNVENLGDNVLDWPEEIPRAEVDITGHIGQLVTLGALARPRASWNITALSLAIEHIHNPYPSVYKSD